MDQQSIQQLIEKYRKGKAQGEELNALNDWYRNVAYTDAEYPDSESAVRERMLRRLHGQIAIPRKKLWPKIVAAAAVLLLIITTFYLNRRDVGNDLAVVIPPGSNQATLILADGRQVALSKMGNAEVLHESGVKISKATDGILLYDASGGSHQRERLALNTLRTPRGGQYQLTLPDGTRAWLNAASSVRFPVSFEGSFTRTIEITGEVYFEVAKDRHHPFLVKSQGQEIEVLGTHFNVNAYADERVTTTTLLEGSVKVVTTNAGSEILKPGQQSIFSAGRLRVQKADVERAMAWKNALFLFDHDRLEDIMKKVSRWYDVEVIYLDERAKQEQFSGKISRFEQAAEVLKKLSLTGAVKFKIEGRRILVMK